MWLSSLFTTIGTSGCKDYELTFGAYVTGRARGLEIWTTILTQLPCLPPRDFLFVRAVLGRGRASTSSVRHRHSLFDSSDPGNPNKIGVVWPFDFSPPWGPPEGRGNIATLKFPDRETPSRKGLYSNLHFPPPWQPGERRGYVASLISPHHGDPEKASAMYPF